VSAPASQSAAAFEAAARNLALDPAAAQAAAEALLRAAPGDPRGLLILAAARRRLGDPAAALAVLEPLARAWPQAANTRYELGLALADLARAKEALAALREAVRLNPDLADAWRAIGDLLFVAGDESGALDAYARQRMAALADPGLKALAALMLAGRQAEAEAGLRARLVAQPDTPRALRLLAEIYMGQDRQADAEILLTRAVELEPADAQAHFALAEARFRQQKATAALDALAPLLASAPEDAACLNLKAACLALLGRDEEVLAIYEGLLARLGRQPRLWVNHGHALRAVGRRDEAVAAYRKALELAPALGEAYWSLANLKAGALDAADRQAIEALLSKPDLAADDRLHLCYAAGKAAEDADEPADAFARYAEGAALRRAVRTYDPDADRRQTGQAIAGFTPELFAARRGSGAQDPDPIFIVGLPRSGSTLLEQILASHPQVEGSMELPYLGLIARGLGETYPERLPELPDAALQALGRGYLEAVRDHRRTDRPFFTDKMPNNFAHVGLIQLILPKAKIVDARRHPLAAGFSAFKQLFAQGQSFTYDLADLGGYYRDYARLMDHFDDVLPGRVHRVIYEDLVADLEGEVRRLLAYCGLPFDEACLRFHETGRAVRTVSSEQVRRPIFRDALDQWRAYEPWLDPMKAALGPALSHWRGRRAD
jgi:tetratricopeptide (TPR) repeat protein